MTALDGVLEYIIDFAQYPGPHCTGCEPGGWPHVSVQRLSYSSILLTAHRSELRGWQLVHRIARYHGEQLNYYTALTGSGIPSLPLHGEAVAVTIVAEYKGAEHEFNEYWSPALDIK